MFQDIAPRRFRNEYPGRDPTETDYILFVKDGRILTAESHGVLSVPRFDSISCGADEIKKDAVYLFSIDGDAFFLSAREREENGGFHYRRIREMLQMDPQHIAFACATAMHLAQ